MLPQRKSNMQNQPTIPTIQALTEAYQTTKGGGPAFQMRVLRSVLSEDLRIIETDGRLPPVIASFGLQTASVDAPTRERPFGQLLAFGQGIVFLVGPQFDGVPGADTLLGLIVRLNPPDEFSAFTYVPLDKENRCKLSIISSGSPMDQVPEKMMIGYDFTSADGETGKHIVPKERNGHLIFFLIKHLPHQFVS